MDSTSIQRFMKLDQETGKQIWRKILPLYLNTDDETYIQAVADKAMILGYTRLLRRTLRREANTELGQKSIAYYKNRLAELLERVDTLVF